MKRKRRPIKVRNRQKDLGSVDEFQWEEIVDEYEGWCAYCSVGAQHQDHVIPLARGGVHEPWNVVPACARCNYRKGTNTWQPKRPHRFMTAEQYARFGELDRRHKLEV